VVSFFLTPFVEVVVDSEQQEARSFLSSSFIGIHSCPSGWGASINLPFDLSYLFFISDFFSSFYLLLRVQYHISFQVPRSCCQCTQTSKQKNLPCQNPAPTIQKLLDDGKHLARNG
jgi:hypothetical protein